MKVSVILITYNHEKYISKAVEGLLMQRDCPEFELIVCDDCSSDNTVTIITEMVTGLANVVMHSNNNNLGITLNYQQAFLKCRGEYIFVLEGDDYWIDPLKLKKQVEFLDQHTAVVMCAHTFFSLKDDKQGLMPPANHKDEPYTFFQSKELILDQGIISNFSTCCYRRNILEMISPKTYDTTSYEWMINISVGQFGVMARINEPMSVYRISSAGAWSNKTYEQQLTGLIGILEVYDKILDYQFAEYFSKKKKMLENDLTAHLQINQKPGNMRGISVFNLPIRLIKKLFFKP